MKELDKTKIYDLSELTSEEKGVLLKHMKEVHGWKDNDIHTDLYFNMDYGWLYNMVNKVPDMTNAKELFYTLENIHVDCSKLTQEQIKEMCKVYESNGYKQWIDPEAFIIIDNFTYLRIDSENEFYITGGLDTKTTITYKKFMELFGYKEKSQEFKNLVDVLNEELTEEAYKETEYEVKYIAEKPKHYAKGIDTFARMEANCTTDECLAFAKGNIDKYNFRTKGQDLEDYKKIVSYANWAISLLNKA